MKDKKYKLLEIASYGIWRSIMGAKYEEKYTPSTTLSRYGKGGSKQ